MVRSFGVRSNEYGGWLPKCFHDTGAGGGWIKAGMGLDNMVDMVDSGLYLCVLSHSTAHKKK